MSKSAEKHLGEEIKEYSFDKSAHSFRKHRESPVKHGMSAFEIEMDDQVLETDDYTVQKLKEISNKAKLLSVLTITKIASLETQLEVFQKSGLKLRTCCKNVNECLSEYQINPNLPKPND